MSHFAFNKKQYCTYIHYDIALLIACIKLRFLETPFHALEKKNMNYFTSSKSVMFLRKECLMPKMGNFSRKGIPNGY